ncbi:hypothetical protein AX279_22455 [Pseudomonas sp. J237]|nr:MULTISPECIES: hypothetical protein [Pseudomonas]OEO23090.1 hypothetical protein AX279_22455 [Pseudomonas sp. J237]
MANRSKKVVLSARIEPYLKDGLELYARLRHMKIVEALEDILELAQDSLNINNPFLKPEKEAYKNKVALSGVVSTIWSSDQVIYTLRRGYIGNHMCDELEYLVVAETMSRRFAGDFDIFEQAKKKYSKSEKEWCLAYPRIDIEKVRAEWPYLQRWAEFAIKSKPAVVDYDDYLMIIAKGDPAAPSP